MKRQATIMKVYPKFYEEYQKRHQKLWPEMQEMLHEHGVSNYSIFLDRQTGQLFAYLESSNQEEFAKISESPITKKWWHYMAPLMETNPDESPVSQNLEEVFYLA